MERFQLQVHMHARLFFRVCVCVVFVCLSVCLSLFLRRSRSASTPHGPLTPPHPKPTNPQFKQLDEAIVAVIDYLGMQPCDGTAASATAGAASKGHHNLHLAGVFVGNRQVLVRAQLQLDEAAGMILKVGAVGVCGGGKGGGLCVLFAVCLCGVQVHWCGGCV